MYIGVVWCLYPNIPNKSQIETFLVKIEKRDGSGVKINEIDIHTKCICNQPHLSKPGYERISKDSIREISAQQIDKKGNYKYISNATRNTRVRNNPSLFHRFAHSIININSKLSLLLLLIYQ